MAVVVKNTFLDVSGHKFLHFDEPCASTRRYNSVPREFKPAVWSDMQRFRTTLPDISPASSDITSPASSDRFPEDASRIEEINGSKCEMELCGDCGDCDGKTPMSTSSTPPLIRRRWNRAFTLPVTVACTQAAVTNNFEQKDDLSLASFLQSPTAEADMAAGVPTFMVEDNSHQQSRIATTADGIVEHVCSALASCNQIMSSEVRKDLPGRYPLLVWAEMQKGQLAAHDVMHLVRRTLAEVTSSFQHVSVMSSRLQKEENGYSLRVSIACVPESQENNVCWDMFRKGHCRRRCQCRWYHPKEEDLIKLKVTIKCFDEVKQV